MTWVIFLLKERAGSGARGSLTSPEVLVLEQKVLAQEILSRSDHCLSAKKKECTQSVHSVEDCVAVARARSCHAALSLVQSVRTVILESC